MLLFFYFWHIQHHKVFTNRLDMTLCSKVSKSRAPPAATNEPTHRSAGECL